MTSAGLCSKCVHVRTVESRRGSTFYRCGASDTDPRLPRYPRLPVWICPAYSAVGGAEGEGPAGT